MNTPYVFKRCTKCKRWLIASSNNFSNNKKAKWGLNYKCKKCIREYDYKRKGKKPPKEIPNGYKKCTKCGRILPSTTEYFNRRFKNNDDVLIAQCKDCYKENYIEYYYEGNGKEVKQDYYNNRGGREVREKYKNSEQGKEAYARATEKYETSEKGINTRKMYNTSEHGKKVKKEWEKSERGQALRFNSRCKRRVKFENQGKGITPEQWREMMTFFNWGCAYSGVKFYDFKNTTRSIDHIISINSGGLNEIWNVVPMHIPYNSSKHCRDDVMNWYREQEYFSEERLKRIVEWQLYAYDKWSTEEDDELILIIDL